MVPLVFTEQLDAIKTYYRDRLGTTVVMEDGNSYFQVRFGSEETRPELAFCPPLPEASPIGAHDAFTQGLMVSVPVEDADAYRKELVERGVEVPEPTDKPWGWRSFLLRDPAGVTLDFYHVIADHSAQDASS
jgi:uncharacterized glyoxalase superfamily protein PhnB